MENGDVEKKLYYHVNKEKIKKRSRDHCGNLGEKI